MKTIFRILIILAAAALVGGIIFALVNSNTSEAPSEFGRHGGAEFRPADNDESRPGENGAFAQRPERGREELGGFFFPEGIIKGLLVVSVVAAVWLNAGKLFGRRKAA